MKFLVENKITLDNIEYEYVIVKKKIKHIYFRVKEDLKIYISAPKTIKINYIEKLLIENKDAIKNMYLKEQRKLIDKENLRYLGNELIYIYKDIKPYIENDYIYAKNKEEAQKYIYSRALDVFNARLNQIKHNFQDLPDFRLRVRKMSTRWGVCNKKSNTVTLNTELITKDISLIDYVIIHELCHFKYMNHSKEYWEYVESFCPYYKIKRKELKY